MAASTLVPDHNEAAPTRLLEAEPTPEEVREVDADDTGLPLIDVEASLRHPERGVTVGGGGDGQARHTGRDDGAERLDELGVVVDDEDAAGRARRGRRRERPRLRQRHRVSWSRAAASACR